MNRDRIEGNWKQFKGKVRELWGKLTDDAFERFDGRHEQLAGELQETRGIRRDEAERQIIDFEARWRRENRLQ